jgi:hypothetical protein
MTLFCQIDDTFSTNKFSAQTANGPDRFADVRQPVLSRRLDLAGPAAAPYSPQFMGGYSFGHRHLLGHRGTEPRRDRAVLDLAD